MSLLRTKDGVLAHTILFFEPLLPRRGLVNVIDEVRFAFAHSSLLETIKNAIMYCSFWIYDTFTNLSEMREIEPTWQFNYLLHLFKGIRKSLRNACSRLVSLFLFTFLFLQLLKLLQFFDIATV